MHEVNDRIISTISRTSDTCCRPIPLVKSSQQASEWGSFPIWQVKSCRSCSSSYLEELTSLAVLGRTSNHILTGMCIKASHVSP